MTTTTTPPPGGYYQPGPPKPRRDATVVAVFVSAVIVTAAVLFVLVFNLTNKGGGSEPQGYQAGSPAAIEGAKGKCRELTLDVLKAPATAKFVDGATAEYGDGYYDVAGQVDAQNGYGALIRNEYQCRLETADGYAWSEVNGGALVSSPDSY